MTQNAQTFTCSGYSKRSIRLYLVRQYPGCTSSDWDGYLFCMWYDADYQLMATNSRTACYYLFRQITHRCRQHKKSRKEYGYRNDMEANGLFRKVKSIKSEQTMDGDILVLEERQAYCKSPYKAMHTF